MAKGRTQGPSEESGEPPKKTTTKIDPPLLKKARQVAISRGIDLYDYIDAMLRPAVERDYDRWIQEEARRRRPKPPSDQVADD